MDNDDIFLEGIKNIGGNRESAESAKSAESIEQLNWEEVEVRFKTDLTSKFIFELGKLRGKDFMRMYLQFAEFVMPKKQRVEGSSGIPDTNVTIQVLKAEDEKESIVMELLKQEGLELPDKFSKND